MLVNSFGLSSVEYLTFQFAFQAAYASLEVSTAVWSRIPVFSDVALHQ
jgi:hypothetical protein